MTIYDRHKLETVTMILHKSKQVQRKHHTVTTTLCGRMNKQSRDGMNIAATDVAVSCKFCLQAMKRERNRKFDAFIKEIEAVCRKHKAQIAVDGYDAIQIHALRSNDVPVYANGIINCLDNY